MADDYNLLLQKYPGRDKQIEQLLSIIPISESIPKSYSFVIEGPPSTGKISVVEEVLLIRKQIYLLIDCYECYNPALLYNKILNELFGNYDGYVSAHISTFYGFFSTFRKYLHQFKVDLLKTQYIIFRHFDNVDKAVIDDILFLEAKFSHIWKFCSIFIVTDGIIFEVNMRKHLKIRFSRYTAEQLREILLLLRKEYPIDIYRSFLQIFVTSVFDKERNLRDLLRLVDFFFPIYKKPIDEGKIDSNEPRMLFNHLKPYMQTYSDPTNLILYSRINYEESTTDIIDSSERFSYIDLPFYTKYLLLAAYLASYLPSKSDRQLFCRRALKKKRNATKKLRSDDNEVNLLTGPKPFPLNRLLAIYFSIVEEHSNISATLLSQIASLVELKLLVLSGKDENIDQPQYKCIARENLVVSVAKTVKFDLKKFFH